MKKLKNTESAQLCVMMITPGGRGRVGRSTGHKAKGESFLSFRWGGGGEEGRGAVCSWGRGRGGESTELGGGT